MTTQYTRHLTPTDASGIARVVGFYEYTNALQNLDSLVHQIKDPDELDAVNQIVSERDEYTVFSQNLMAGADDKREQRGLAWVMALARIEVASMLATLTNTPSPFQTVKPTQFEYDAYVQLLLEGAHQHYQALATDPLLLQVTRMSPAQPAVLAYARRLVLARSMLTAAIQMGQDRYTPNQWQQLASAKGNLDRIQAGMLLKVQLYLRETNVVRGTSTNTEEFQNACGALLRAESRELASGKATVRSFRD